jgi:hypothetical protein
VAGLDREKEETFGIAGEAEPSGAAIVKLYYFSV